MTCHCWHRFRGDSCLQARLKPSTHAIDGRLVHSAPKKKKEIGQILLALSIENPFSWGLRLEHHDLTLILNITTPTPRACIAVSAFSPIYE